MRIVRNTIFLYVSLFCGFILGVLQLKILSNALDSNKLGELFTIIAFAQILSQVLLLGTPLVLVRYIPKFFAENRKDKALSLILLLFIVYIIICAIVYIILNFYGNKISMAIYKNESISQYIHFIFLVFSVVNLSSIIFAAFNGLRKMHISAGIHLLYLIITTISLFWFRKNLSIPLVGKIHLFSVIPSIILGFRCLLFIFNYKAFNLSIFKSSTIIIYWRYAIILGLLSPLFIYIDRTIVGAIFTMEKVAIFTIPAQIIWWVRRILSIPMEAIAPEISYFWEKGDSEILGKKLILITKLNLIFGLFLMTIILIFGKSIILLVSTPKYLISYNILFLLSLSLPFLCVYTPITKAMQATGKIIFYLISDIIWIFIYIGGIFLLKNIDVKGVAISYLLATLFTGLFNVFVAKYHTNIDFKSVIKNLIIFSSKEKTYIKRLLKP